MATTAEVIQDTHQQTSNSGKTGRRKALIWVGALVGGILVLLSIRYLVWSSGHEETDDAYLAAHVHPIGARVTDTVDHVLVDDNQQVKAGQILVLLDPNDYRVRADRAKAALDAAKREVETANATIQTTAQTATAQLTEAKGSIGEAHATIEASRAAVLAAQAGVTKAEAQATEADATLGRETADLHRYETLYAKEQVSRQAVDHQRASYQVATAAQAAAKQQVQQAIAQLSAVREGVARAQAQLTRSQGTLQQAKATGLEVRVREGQLATATAAADQARSALAEAELELSYTTIAAPVAGRVGRKSVEAGQRVQVGQPLMAIVEDNPWIVANLKETQLAKMRPGQLVEVRIDTFSGHTFHGHVDSVAPGSGNQFALLPPDNATGNFTKIVQRIPVKIVLDRESVRGYENRLTPGMSSVVTVATR